ncbi:tyrosine-type recombinase/integrase [Halobium palmae]|uniref:Tyrosine-type recombinase/integrase n=1 Tax=Halobium palmae TaxID=1776492 RepID=A0ABD5RVN9_9EURY
MASSLIKNEESPRNVTVEELREVFSEELSRGVLSDSEDLVPHTPDQCVKKYLENKQSSLSNASQRDVRSSLSFVTKWCHLEGINNMNKLRGTHLQDFRTWRREESSNRTDTLSPATMISELRRLADFLREIANFDAVQHDLHTKVTFPNISEEAERKMVVIEHDRMERILNHLNKYKYATTEHVALKILAETGMRVGGLRSIDIDDIDRQKGIRMLLLRHRPSTDTPLKNGRKGERNVSISEELGNLIDDYISVTPDSSTDDFGRRPLLTTSQGRPNTGTVRKWAYQWSRPCAINETCPLGRNPRDCEATERDKESRCPESRSTHPIRRGYITHLLNEGVSKYVVSNRCNVSVEVLEKHYDASSDSEKSIRRWKQVTDS